MTAGCLEALQRTEAREVAEVVVVDDASPDDTVDHLRAFPWVRVVPLRENIGYTRACNAAAADATTEFIFMLNNDTVPLAGFLASSLELADSDPSIAIVASRLLYPNGSLQDAGAIVWSDGTGVNYGNGESADGFEFLHVRDVDYGSGAAILVRASFWHSVGGYDEQYAPAYFEDTDLAFAARARGCRVVYQPRSVVVHLEGVSNGRSTASGIKRYQEINRPKFVEKWATALAEQPMPGQLPIRVAARREPRRAILYLCDQVMTRDGGVRSDRSTQVLRSLRGMGYEVAVGAEAGQPYGPDADRIRQEGSMVLFGRRAVRRFVGREGDWLQMVFVSGSKMAEAAERWLGKYPGTLPLVFDAPDLQKLLGSEWDELRRSSAEAKSMAKLEHDVIRFVRSCTATLVVSEADREFLRGRVPGATIVTLDTTDEVRASGDPLATERLGEVLAAADLRRTLSP